jgi:hypothetical protein
MRPRASRLLAVGLLVVAVGMSIALGGQPSATERNSR